MTSSYRNRQRRTRSERTPAVVLTPALMAERDLPAVRHGLRDVAMNWRLLSGMIVVCLLLVLFLFFSADVFYVRAIGVSGTRYLAQTEIFRLAGIADTHVFWIDPAEVRERILEFPAIADAEITLGWPPQMVRITITEREPALVWNQAGVEAWVDIHGNVLMRPPEERDDLLRIEVTGVDAPISINDTVPQDVVAGARQLRELLPAATALRYDPVNGLGFTAEGGWRAWFGSGLDMPTKITIYKALIAELGAQGITPSEVSVVNPDAPFICQRLTGCG